MTGILWKEQKGSIIFISTEISHKPTYVCYGAPEGKWGGKKCNGWEKEKNKTRFCEISQKVIAKCRNYFIIFKAVCFRFCKKKQK